METKTVNNVMLIYAYDTQNDGKELGPGSKERLNAGIKYILESDYNDWIIILGAGRDPKRSGIKALKYMMQSYIEQRLEIAEFDIHGSRQYSESFWRNKLKSVAILPSDTDVWGSFEETVSALCTFFEAYTGKSGYYYAVSSDFHLPRIKLLWWMLGLSLHKTIGTPWKPTWKELILEPVKMVKVILKGIEHHLKGGF